MKNNSNDERGQGSNEKTENALKRELLKELKNPQATLRRDTVTMVTKCNGMVYEESKSPNGDFVVKRKVGKTPTSMAWVRQRKNTRPTHHDRHQKNTKVPSDERQRMSCDDIPRFNLDDPQMVEYYRENGFVVIRSVLDQEEQIRTATTKLWEFLETSLGWKRCAPATWTTESFHNVGMPANGIMNGNGVGQCDLQWYLRQMPLVQQAFRTIWTAMDTSGAMQEGTTASQLLTSFDGICVFRPWQRDVSWRTREGWLHVDQGRGRKGFKCVQGFVSLTDSDSRTGGFTVVKGSHRFHSALVDAHSLSDQDFVQVPSDSPSLPPGYIQQNTVLVPIKAGDMVLWDSRTIHANAPASDRPVGMSKDQLLRVVAYICMMPKCRLTGDSTRILKARRVAFENGVTSSHWPDVMPQWCFRHEAKRRRNNNNHHGDYEGVRFLGLSSGAKSLVG